MIVDRGQTLEGVEDLGSLQVTLDLRLYGLTAIKKAAYRVAERCTVVLEDPTDINVKLTFRFPPKTSDVAAQEAVRCFYQEVLDEDLREHLHQQTDALRSLLLAHTFSKTNLIERS